MNKEFKKKDVLLKNKDLKKINNWKKGQNELLYQNTTLEKCKNDTVVEKSFKNEPKRHRLV